MEQDRFFLEIGGNAWFNRNKDRITNVKKPDFPLYIIELIEDKKAIKNVLELGCSNGFRLEHLRSLRCGSHFVGIDCSAEALEDGRRRYPEIEFYKGLLTKLPLDEQFDLVIVNLVLCWVSRATIAQSVAEIDRVVRDRGFLVLGDFFPDYPQRRRYHHNLDEEIYTYKQDYAKIFESLNTYREIARITYNHDQPLQCVQITDTSKRAACSLLEKSLYEFYLET